MNQGFKVIVVERQIDENNRKANNQRVEFISYVDAVNGSFLMLIQVFSEKLLSTNYADVIFSETFVYSRKHLTTKTIEIHKGRT